MQHEHRVGELLVPAGHPEDLGVGDGLAIVGEGDGAELLERGHLRELVAAHALRDAGGEADADDGLLARLLQQRPEHGGGVDDRFVFGIATMPVKPPAAADAVPVAIVSL